MIKFRSLFAGLAICLGFASCLTLPGCAMPGADPNASSPATSHFKADLASGFYAVEAVRAAGTAALQTQAITIAQAQAVRIQCNAFTATLKSLEAAGQTANSQDTLTATLSAIKAAKIFVTMSQAGVPKP